MWSLWPPGFQIWLSSEYPLKIGNTLQPTTQCCIIYDWKELRQSSIPILNLRSANCHAVRPCQLTPVPLGLSSNQRFRGWHSIAILIVLFILWFEVSGLQTMFVGNTVRYPLHWDCCTLSICLGNISLNHWMSWQRIIKLVLQCPVVLDYLFLVTKPSSTFLMRWTLNNVLEVLALSSHPYTTSDKLSGFLTPSPCQYQIHATFNPLVRIWLMPMPIPPSLSADVIYGWPLNG